jgi:hypothetical protein
VDLSVFAAAVAIPWGGFFFEQPLADLRLAPTTANRTQLGHFQRGTVRLRVRCCPRGLERARLKLEGSKPQRAAEGGLSDHGGYRPEQRSAVWHLSSFGFQRPSIATSKVLHLEASSGWMG